MNLKILSADIQRPLISVITVVLNGEKSIERTIQSVIGQKFNDIEYIIIDGGSKDGTVDIIKKYRNHIDYWISEKDDGISDAFNKGLKAANGEIIGIINSDDWYEDDTFDYIAGVFKTVSPDVIVGKMRYWDNEQPVYIFDARPENLYKEMTVNHQASFIKRSVYEKSGLFDRQYRYAMDYELMLRFKIDGSKFYVSDRIIANMRYKGVSDRYWRRAYLESRQIKETLTKKKFGPMLYYYFQIIRTYVSKAMDVIGLSVIKHIYRKYFSVLKKEAL